MTADAPVGSAIRIEACRGCCSRDLRLVLDLGDQPACDYFPPIDAPTPDPRWPLALVMCADCGLVQLDHRSPAPEEPLAVESATLKQHAVEVSRRLCESLDLGAGTRVREFSSHHGGSWLAPLLERGCDAVDQGTADVVIDNHSIIHAEDLETELAVRVAAMSPGGYLVIEFHHALAQLEQGQFDTVRHGHPLYFSLTAWRNACQRHGLEVVAAWPEDVFGGCLVVVATHATATTTTEHVEGIQRREQERGAANPVRYAELNQLARRSAAAFTNHLRQAADAGRRVVAYGAGSKAVTFLGVAGVDIADLPLVADLSRDKHGRRIPGAGIPIVSPEDLVAARPDEVMIMTWDIATEVMTQLRGMGLSEAAYYVPLPALAQVG